MSRSFVNYSEARAFAEQQVCALRIAHGIEKMSDPFRGKNAICYSVKMLPRPENRSGWELRCETVEVESRVV